MGMLDEISEKKQTISITVRENEAETDLDGVTGEEKVEKDDASEQGENQEKGAETADIDPLECFFMRGENAEKWLVKLARIWHYVISVFWFFMGALTFAPVIYMAHKSRPIFKDKKKSLIFGIGVYLAIVAWIVIMLVT